MRKILAVLLVASAVRAQAQQTPPALVAFLKASIGLDATQLAAMERGEIVVKVMPSANERDVAVFGVATLDVPRDVYVARVRDFRTSLVAPARTQLGIFGDPPVARDMQAFSVSRDDAADLKTCRPGNCSMKLPVNDMRIIREQMHWSSPDVHNEVSVYARKRFLEYVIDYRARGDSAMAIFADRGNVSARAAFAEILGDSPLVFQRVPSVVRYLTAYPAGKLPAATEVFYWSEDELPRLRPIVSITHEIVLTPPELPQSTIIAAKQIYANHYFEAGFDMTSVLDRPLAGGKTGSYVVTLRRFRFDNLPGGLLNIKGKAISALREQLQVDLKRYKTDAERVR